MEKNINDFLSPQAEPSTVSALPILTLAYVGDAVFELMVRTYLTKKFAQKAGQLHLKAIEIVKAASQSEATENILPALSEEEQSIYRRGRNAKGTFVPKNANVMDYRRATGFEALMGFLYLTGRQSRLNELFSIVVNENDSI